jgi:hypothetical protein
MYSAEQIAKQLREQFGDTINASHINQYCRENDISYQTVTKKIESFKTGRGVWCLTIEQAQEQLEETFNQPAVMPKTPVNLIPDADPNYVPFGNYKDVKKIIQSGIFYPCFITGLSGNGKTQSISQACAALKREMIRVNITIETDEDDLLGGFRLVNGETVWHNGPVIEAMQRGAILLLDEVDLASNKIMCLQSVLEGKGVFLKKINQFITPAPGFNIIATANTKGKGSDDGRFVGTNVLSEALLERFSATFEQEYPSAAIEKKILVNYMKELNCIDENFADKLITWCEVIRKTFYDGGVDELISTRRLIHIIKAFSIFNDRKKAIEVCINRFDEDTKTSFMSLYEKVDADVKPYEYTDEDQ